MDWNVRPLQNTDAKENLQNENSGYTPFLSNAHAFSQTDVCFSKNACTYAGNNQTVHPPTSNVTFPLVNADQTLPGACIAGNDFSTSKYSVNRHPPPPYFPILPKPPNRSSHLWTEMTHTAWPNSIACVYSLRNVPSSSSQMNAGNNTKNVFWQPPPYVTSNGYTVQPQMAQHSSMRNTAVPQSNIHSQTTSVPLGTSEQPVQNQIQHPNAQFQALHLQSQAAETNLQLPQYQPSQMRSEPPSRYSAPAVLTGYCDSRAAAQSSMHVSQAFQNVPTRYSPSQQRCPSDPKTASGFSSVQQYCQKQPSGEIGQSVRNVCNSNKNVTANQPFNEMSASSTGIYKELYDTVQKFVSLTSAAPSKLPNNPASIQESQMSTLMSGLANSQTSSATADKATNIHNRLSWEAQKLLTLKKKSLLLERMHNYKKNLIAASELDKSTVPPPASHQVTLADCLSCVPEQNGPPFTSETAKTESPVHYSLPEEKNNNNVASSDNRKLEVTQSTPGVSSSSAPIPPQSKLPAQLKNPESTPTLEKRDAYAEASSQTSMTSLKRPSSFGQVDSSINTASNKVSSCPQNSQFLQFALSSTNALKEKTAGATADKILTSLLCSENSLLATSVSSGSLQKDTSERKACSLQGEPTLAIHTNRAVSKPTKSGEAKFQSDLAQKKVPSTDKTSKQNCYSAEELAACLGLWRKDQSNESPAANQVSSYSQNTKNREQNNVVGTGEAVLLTTAASAGQKLDALSCNLIKGFELQVAVVSPLVLAEHRMHSDGADRSPASADKTCPIIDSVSTCGLQEEGKNGLSVVNTSKETAEPVLLSPSVCVLVQKADSLLPQTKVLDENRVVKNNLSANDSHDENETKVSQSAQDARENLQLEIQNKPLPVGITTASQIFQEGSRDHKVKQTVLETGDTSTALLEEQMFCISSVCSLVEGNTFYNPQIASIFSSEKHALNGNSAEGNVSDSKQKEQQLDLSKNELSNNTPKKETLLQKMLEESSSCVRLAGVTTSHLEKEDRDNLPETVPTSEQKTLCTAFLNQPENYLEILSSINQQLAQNSPDFSTSVSHETNALVVPEDSNKQNDVSSKSSTEKEINLFGAEPIKYLNNQLSELVLEFPYGIEGADMLTKEPVQNDFMPEQMENQPQKEIQISDRNSHSKDPVDQIKIAALSSGGILELFPEHNWCSSNDSKRIVTQPSEKAETANLDGSSLPSENPCENKKRPPKPSSPGKEKKKDCACNMPQCHCKFRVPSSEENDDTISKAEHSSSTEKQENTKSLAIMSTNCAVGNLPMSKKIPNDVSKTNDICKYTSITNEKARLKVNNEYRPLTTQQEIIVPLDSSRNQDIDKLRSWKEEVQMDSRSPLLDRECNSDKKEQQPASEEPSEKAGHTDAENTTQSSRKKEEVFKLESFSKDKTKTGLTTKFKAVSHKSVQSETVEVKHTEDSKGQKIKTCGENSAEDQNCEKQKEILAQEVGTGNKEKAKSSAEVKRRKLNNYCADAKKFINFGAVDLRRNPKYSQHKSMKVYPSQEQSYKRKRKENTIGRRGLKKTKVEERLKQSEAKCSKQLSHNCMINTDKAKKLPGENGWKTKSSLADRSVLKLQRKRAQSAISKNYFSNKERHLDDHNKDKCSEKISPDKNLLYLSRRNNRLKLQKEPKKHYLNRVAFKRGTQERIYLTKLDTSPVRPICHPRLKVSHKCPDAKSGGSSTPGVEKSLKLEFKLCPEILFRAPATDESLSAKNSLETEKAVVAGIKSKKEDWLKYDPAKEKKLKEKLEEISAAEECIPLDTAIQILDGDCEALHVPNKDSKEVFNTYRKMYLEKKTLKP